ncbi:hypothetical protein CPB83DRAFT_60725 [Crepidotus variabilis]|uniref:Uncharacterized protein n=1 Tax=Crepidotus variabilis TaxID=179855 RepID=A0A9P6E5U1_9AGAR|nr:hypothetical protein CPB83DRAFT_60725 [Crepidotus variabilis]
MFARLSLLAWSFSLLWVCTASAKPTTEFSRSSGIEVSETLKTNAERLAAGLSPFPPVRRWLSSRVDSARRGVPSSIPTGGQILVRSDDGTSNLGYLSDGTVRGFYTLAPTLLGAGIFTSTGKLLHRSTATTESPYVAALIAVNRNILVAGTINAILGDSAATDPGAKAQPNNDPVFSGYDIESAIWTHDLGTGSVTAQLVQDDGTTVSTTIILFNDNFYLIPDPTTVLERYTAAQAVTFTLL